MIRALNRGLSEKNLRKIAGPKGATKSVRRIFKTTSVSSFGPFLASNIRVSSTRPVYPFRGDFQPTLGDWIRRKSEMQKRPKGPSLYTVVVSGSGIWRTADSSVDGGVAVA